MKLYFTGSDVLLLTRYPRQSWRKWPYIFLTRLFVRISKFCIEEYWSVHEHLNKDIERYGIHPVTVQHPYNMTIYPKKKHGTFNVLYYCPVSVKDKKINEWIYGYDIYQRIKYWYRDDRKLTFIEVDGSQDMSEIWPVTDFVLRCNRHDGGARMIDEAKLQDIPYYWSYEKPDFHEIVTIIEINRK